VYIALHVKFPLFLPYFKETWIFQTDPLKISQIPNFMKICPLRADLFHADGQTDTTKLIFAVCKFWERAQKLDVSVLIYVFVINNSTPGTKPTLSRLRETTLRRIANYTTLIKTGQVVKTKQSEEFHHQLWENCFYWLWVKRDSLQIRLVYGTSVCIEAWSANVVSRSVTCKRRVSPRDWARRRLARWPLIDHIPHQVTAYLNITWFWVLNWQAQ
jgi:hypothetical protein